jgi:hypothetical protein
MGAVDFLVHGGHGGVAVLVRVPLEERHILGRDLDKACARLDQTPCEQAAAAKAAGVIFRVALLWLQRDVEGLALLRAEQAIRVVHAAEHGFLLVIAHELALRALID